MNTDDLPAVPGFERVDRGGPRYSKHDRTAFITVDRVETQSGPKCQLTYYQRAGPHSADVKRVTSRMAELDEISEAVEEITQ